MNTDNGRLLIEPIVVETVQFKITEIQGPRGPQGPQGIQGPTGPQGPSGVIDPLLSHYTNDVPFLTIATLPPYPTIPTNISAFTNDVGYITGSSTEILTNKTWHGNQITDAY